MSILTTIVDKLAPRNKKYGTSQFKSTHTNNMATQVQSLADIAKDSGIIWNEETPVSDATYVVQVRTMQLQEAILDHLEKGVTHIYETH